LDLAVELGIALGLLFWGWVAWEALRSHVRKPGHGTTFAVDQPALGGMCQLTSERWGLTGRPDELRRLKDGTIIPAEIKSGAAPRSGVPYPSHRVQLLAYCALVEEAFGRGPPYGVLVYGDGSEVRVPWDGRGRAELKAVVGRWAQPYMGEADPNPGKCGGCQFRGACSYPPARG
jgi:CRISPR/Cas system-associated exonuclease Cas4 (RecB family)